MAVITGRRVAGTSGGANEPDSNSCAWLKADLWWAFAISLAHVLLAGYFGIVRGIRIADAPPGWAWHWYWQAIPIDLLQSDLLRSLWYLHSQPPLYNLWAGILAKLFDSHFLDALYIANVVFGAALAGMVYLICIQVMRNRLVSLAVALVVAFCPSLFLYEAYALYDLTCAFLVTATVFCLAWHRSSSRHIALYTFILSLNLLVLTRSIYQALILPVALGLVWFLVDFRQRNRVIAICLSICVLSGIWYVKNAAIYGLLSTSSWSGMGLWRIASLDYGPDELLSLTAQGVLDPVVVEQPAFSRPSQYERYGFDLTSDVEVLAGNNYHNINFIAIAHVYGANAVRLILLHPTRYLRSVFRAYLQFSMLSSRFKHLTVNAAKIAPLEWFYANAIHGRFLLAKPGFFGGSLQVVILPAALLLYVTQFVRSWRRESRDLADAIRHDAVLLWCFVLIVYTTIVACIAEYGEQERFKFLVEQLILILVVAVVSRELHMYRTGTHSPASLER